MRYLKKNFVQPDRRRHYELSFFLQNRFHANLLYDLLAEYFLSVKLTKNMGLVRVSVGSNMLQNFLSLIFSEEELFEEAWVKTSPTLVKIVTAYNSVTKAHHPCLSNFALPVFYVLRFNNFYQYRIILLSIALSATLYQQSLFNENDNSPSG